MRKIQAVSVFAGLSLMAACAPLTSQGRVEALQRAQPTGSAFTQRLAQEYRDLAVFEQKEMFDYIDAGYFADKGMRAARGEAVPPEDPNGPQFRVPQNRAGELQAARARLVGLLDAGAREQQPVQAALAQVKYDCWVEQQEENWQVDDIAACRGEFLAAMAQLAPPPAPAVTTQQQYLVFFDWDRADITSGGAQVLDTVARDFRARGVNSVTILGHADLSGPPGYNQRLSERRSAAVRQALAQRGIPTNAIRTAGRGESQPMVSTPDGVREPANRRAEIRFGDGQQMSGMGGGAMGGTMGGGAMGSGAMGSGATGGAGMGRGAMGTSGGAAGPAAGSQRMTGPGTTGAAGSGGTTAGARGAGGR